MAALIIITTADTITSLDSFIAFKFSRQYPKHSTNRGEAFTFLLPSVAIPNIVARGEIIVKHGMVGCLA